MKETTQKVIDSITVWILSIVIVGILGLVLLNSKFFSGEVRNSYPESVFSTLNKSESDGISDDLYFSFRAPDVLGKAVIESDLQQAIMLVSKWPEGARPEAVESAFLQLVPENSIFFKSENPFALSGLVCSGTGQDVSVGFATLVSGQIPAQSIRFTQFDKEEIALKNFCIQHKIE